MAKLIKVTAPCVVVNVSGAERYLYKGATVPSGVDRKDITRLKNNGLIAEVDVPEADTAADDADAKAVAEAKAAAEKAAAEPESEKPEPAKPAGRAAAK